tara:strand:+ start:10368 stop:13790 length:3423 start_codon:yes stop_codon:yes gene_type:complete
MQALDKILRHQLERAVKSARDTAEKGAQAAMGQLGVADATPAAHLNDADRELRRRLRAHGRQLGDSLNGGKVQSMNRLVEEVAYEHWHRMLFARFLAENNLLMYPDPDEPVAITLEECEDLAADEGAANGWELAARYAAQMLPQIFRLDSPVFQLTLPPEHQQALERLVSGLPQEAFTASDSLGWVYQFWQANNKERINKSEVKIGARELPAVTQLFTEPYMVSFLLDNSLGAWWAARTLTEDDLKNAQSEEELRQKAAIPGVPLEYLRFVKDENGTWTPASGTFDAWPENLADLKTLDPCCGSGHFLVAAFLMLVPMRMDRDSLSATDAVDAVLRENIHGLELDQRCVELAAFALALTAWKHPGAGGYRMLPDLNVACSGLSIGAKKEEWLDLAGDNTNLRIALEELYQQFKHAPVLGSLINPEASLGKGSLFELKWEEVAPALNTAIAIEKDDAKKEMGVVASGLVTAADLLSKKYSLVCTNVPFLGELKQSERLREFTTSIGEYFKIDLAYSMLFRILKFLSQGGSASIVIPMDWLIQTKNRLMRKYLFSHYEVPLIVKLGRGAFQYQVGKDVMLLNLNNNVEGEVVKQIDLTNIRSTESIQDSIHTSDLQLAYYKRILKDKNFLISLKPAQSEETLEKYCDVFRGLSTGDSNRFYRNFQEVRLPNDDWEFLRQTSSFASEFSGMSDIIFWQNENGELAQLAESLKDRNHAVQSWRRGKPFWDKQGISVNRMGSFRATLYRGERYSETAGVIIPKNESDLPVLWCYFSSDEFIQDLKTLTHKLDVEPRYLKLLNFTYDRWANVAAEEYPNGLPKPYSNDPTQWIFHGHPSGSVVWDEEQKWTAEGLLCASDTALQVAVARLLGYRWPAELDQAMELADEQRTWVSRCEALLPFADDDGIVCIPPVRGEASAADRLLNLLAAAYGEAWSTDVLTDLLKQADHAGKTLETWLRDKFFTQHCKLFQNRPFIWQVWDGLPDGFSALVNYHKLDRKNLETLIYTYLGDWISRQKQDMNNSIDGAEERLAAAEVLKKKLEQILEGEAPYDIFVRWKPIEQQPTGWNPDLNDGVRLNIRPFLTVDDVKKKGAGILRDKPNIKWTKDRGKDVESAPWFHTFGGERINDHHLTLAEKEAARQECSQ